MFRVKVHHHGKETLVAASDAELVGQTFREGKLKIAVVEAFYGTSEADEKTLLASLRACTVANLVGPRAVEVAIRHGFVDPACVLKIGGVPHAQVATLSP
ncbi:MAG: DUF424 domain-containing protein [Thermoplasmatota archaeon]